MDILETFEYKKFQVLHYGVVDYFNGWVNREFALYLHKNKWLIFHLPSGTPLDNQGFKKIETAAQVILKILSIKNDWQISIEKFEPETVEQIIKIMTKAYESEGASCLIVEIKEVSGSAVPLNDMTY